MGKLQYFGCTSVIINSDPAPLIGLIGHASRVLLWLLLLNGHLVNAVPVHGTDALGAVSSESKTCSEIGIELLRRGVSSFRVDELKGHWD
jgi:hypothetical protein